jgi:hypothetical protein
VDGKQFKQKLIHWIYNINKPNDNVTNKVTTSNNAIQVGWVEQEERLLRDNFFIHQMVVELIVVELRATIIWTGVFFYIEHGIGMQIPENI